jgi:hypothetical protein
MPGQDRKAVSTYGTPHSAKIDSLAQKREAALEGVRARIKNEGVPLKVRSKRNRRANRESR